jgi:hypothetical protein
MIIMGYEGMDSSKIIISLNVVEDSQHGMVIKVVLSLQLLFKLSISLQVFFEAYLAKINEISFKIRVSSTPQTDISCLT